MVLLSIFSEDVEAGKRHSKSLTIAVDWLHGLMGTGGLLLLVSHHLQYQFLLRPGMDTLLKQFIPAWSWVRGPRLCFGWYEAGTY